MFHWISPPLDGSIRWFVKKTRGASQRHVNYYKRTQSSSTRRFTHICDICVTVTTKTNNVRHLWILSKIHLIWTTTVFERTGKGDEERRNLHLSVTSSFPECGHWICFSWELHKEKWINQKWSNICHLAVIKSPALVVEWSCIKSLLTGKYLFCWNAHRSGIKVTELSLMINHYQ